LGQLGNGGVGTTQPSPNKVLGATGWTAVSAGEFHSCGRRTSGRLYCWGHDVSGQLGDGDPFQQQNTPVEVAGNVTTWTNGFSADGFNTCALRTSGRLYCWGENGVGQLGNNDATFTDRSSPVQVAGSRTDWTLVNLGESFACARRSTQRIYCWGNDSTGQLGNGGANTNRLAPTEVAA
jgi:alpha-tubulin suppressor-like RCC1 family protein